MSKFLHTAHAAGNGVYVALLAKEGFSGSNHILEGTQGFLKAMQDKKSLMKNSETSSKFGALEMYLSNLIPAAGTLTLQLTLLWIFEKS